MKNIVLSILGSNNFMNYSLFEEKIYKIITFFGSEFGSEASPDLTTKLLEDA